jgi:hypothetical protein
VTIKQHDRPIWQQGQHSLQLLLPVVTAVSVLVRADD